MLTCCDAERCLQIQPAICRIGTKDAETQTKNQTKMQTKIQTASLPVGVWMQKCRWKFSSANHCFGVQDAEMRAK